MGSALAHGCAIKDEQQLLLQEIRATCLGYENVR